jgi:hypothetical protein
LIGHAEARLDEARKELALSFIARDVAERCVAARRMAELVDADEAAEQSRHRALRRRAVRGQHRLRGRRDAAGQAAELPVSSVGEFLSGSFLVQLIERELQLRKASLHVVGVFAQQLIERLAVGASAEGELGGGGG